jgi:hypothetical protein
MTNSRNGPFISPKNKDMSNSYYDKMTEYRMSHSEFKSNTKHPFTENKASNRSNLDRPKSAMGVRREEKNRMGELLERPRTSHGRKEGGEDYPHSYYPYSSNPNLNMNMNMNMSPNRVQSPMIEHAPHTFGNNTLAPALPTRTPGFSNVNPSFNIQPMSMGPPNVNMGVNPMQMSMSIPAMGGTAMGGTGMGGMSAIPQFDRSRTGFSQNPLSQTNAPNFHIIQQLGGIEDTISSMG